MYKNRIMYGGLWLFGVVFLFFMPGFEARGLAMGMLVGYLPFLGLAQFGIELEHRHPFFVLFAMFIFSGGFVALMSWMMDRRRRRCFRLWSVA
jgi:hypothetical protein